jgi:hypothetical protein
MIPLDAILNCLNQLVVHLLVDKDVVRSDASLARVGELAPANSLCNQREIYKQTRK